MISPGQPDLPNAGPTNPVRECKADPAPGSFFHGEAMTNQTYTDQNVKAAKHNAGLRKRREEDVQRIIAEYKQGRGASACMADIIKAFERK